MDKKQLYESIMRQVSKEIKKVLNERADTNIDETYFSLPDSYKFNGPANICINADSGVDYAMIYPNGQFYFFSKEQHKNLLKGHKMLLKKVEEIKNAINNGTINENELGEDEIEYAYLDIDEISYIITQLEELENIPKGYWEELSGNVYNNFKSYKEIKPMYILGYRF